jgi:hypothetical protein
MPRVSFEQHWHQEDFIADQEDIIETVFLSRDEIQWLMNRGYQPRKSTYVFPGSQSAAWSWTFDLDDDIILLLMLMYPQDQHRLDIIDEEIIERKMYE